MFVFVDIDTDVLVFVDTDEDTDTDQSWKRQPYTTLADYGIPESVIERAKIHRVLSANKRVGSVLHSQLVHIIPA